MSLPARIPTPLVAEKRLEEDVSVHMGLEVVMAIANMVATNPGALKHGRGSLLTYEGVLSSSGISSVTFEYPRTC